MADVERGRAVLDQEIARAPKLVTPQQVSSEVRKLWREGLPSGDRTGWPSLDKHYTVMPGQVTVLTGWPGSGKSEWLDALLVNLSWQGWKFAVFSFENQPVSVHVTKLMEKFVGKPFMHGPNERINDDEIRACEEDMAESFVFAETHSGGISVRSVLEAAGVFLSKFTGKRGLVIDPWNELEHWRPANLTETEYVSQTLSMVRNWARTNKVHVWIVAHPQKMRREDGKLPIPRPDMIAGSQHWWNKADCAITVYRDFEKLDSQDVDIHVQKIRFKHIGYPGLVTLKYDRICGRYSEPMASQITPVRRSP